MKDCAFCNNDLPHSDCPNDNENSNDITVNNISTVNNNTEGDKMNTENTNQRMTFTLTMEQLQQVEELRLSTIAGNLQSVPKTPQQQVHQIVEYGMRALLQQRKQYLRTREALRLMKGVK